MKRKLIALAALSLVSSVTFAQDYQGEVGLNYTDSDNFDATSLFGIWNFERVTTAGQPLAEAAYLDRNSNVQAAITDFDGGDAFAIGAEFYFSDLFYVAPSYVNTDTNFGGDDDEFSVALGLTPIDGLRIATIIPEDDYDANINAKYVGRLSGGNFFNLEASFVDDNNDTFTIGGDYFIDNTFSIGAAVIDNADTDFQIRTQKFFTPLLRGSFSYTFADSDDVISVEGAFRF